MPDTASTLPLWSTTAASNLPAGTTTVGTGLDDNLREIQKVVRGWLATKGANIASAGTTNLGAVEGLSHTITGTTTITNFGIISAGIWKVVIFSGVLTLTHDATSLILPGGVDITTASGDVALLQSEGSGNWRCWSYIRASGLPIVNPPVTTGPFSDSNSLVENSSDGTKEWIVKAGNLTTSTTRTAWLLDESSSIGNDWEIVNGSLAASVSANAITITLKTKAGNNPSATDPVFAQFRSSTLTDGKPVVRTITSALSVTLSSGSTAGTISAQEHRIYAGLADDAGTIRLFAYNPYSYTAGPPRIHSLVGLNENQRYSSTAEGGAGASDSAQVLYSTVGFTSKAIRLLGYIESTQTTAGTWASAPTVVHTLKRGDLVTGAQVQFISKEYTEFASGTTAMPNDNSIPQQSGPAEGDEYMTSAITPISAINLLKIEVSAEFEASGDSVSGMALFQDAVAAALSAAAQDNIAAPEILSLVHVKVAGSAASQTYRIRAGRNGSGTTEFNSRLSARLFGGVNNSYINLTEIFV